MSFCHYYLKCVCASGSVVEHLLAKEGVAGSIPVSRLKKERYQIGIVLFFERWSGLESSMSTLRSGPRSPRSPGPRAPSRACLHGKFQKQKVLRICFGSYRSFILYAHDRGTRLYLAVPYRWGGGTGGFGEPGR